MGDKYNYTLQLDWLGDEHGKHHRDDRRYEIRIDGKVPIQGSADKPFFGHPNFHNPEDLLMAALASCQMMSFLYLCRNEGGAIKSYSDYPEGFLSVSLEGSGKFDHVILQPEIVLVRSSQSEKATQLFEKASKLCFIANSVNFKIQHKITFL